MERKEELRLLVKYVKECVKEAGGSITQDAMAKKLKISRSYLSRLISGSDPVPEEFIPFFKDIFKAHLPKEEEVLKSDIAVLQSSIDVIQRELAKIKRDLYKEKKANGKEKTSTDYLNELLDEVSLSGAGMKVQKGS